MIILLREEDKIYERGLYNIQIWSGVYTIYKACQQAWMVTHGTRRYGCCEVTTRSTKVGYLMYLGNSNGVLLVLILSYCKDESMLLA
jgi:hypothetical protein